MAVDAQHSQVYVVTGKGQQVSVYGRNGTRPVRILKNGIQYAYALAVDSRGYLYVANAGSLYSYGALTVAIFAPGGVAPQRTIRIRNGIGPCSGGVAVDAQRNLYIVDCYFAFHRTADTVEYLPNGKRLRTLHGLGDNAVAVTIVP
jgi:DNA-binding beta-propeller fold protein YncE